MGKKRTKLSKLIAYNVVTSECVFIFYLCVTGPQGAHVSIKASTEVIYDAMIRKVYANADTTKKDVTLNEVRKTLSSGSDGVGWVKASDG
jgi:hypothetical protein